MTVAAITGANRGIGLEFVKQLAEDGKHIIATARDPDGASELHELLLQGPAQGVLLAVVKPVNRQQVVASASQEHP